MEILFVLIPLSLGLVAFALWSFIWSVKNEQFEDLDRQGWSILFDDDDNKNKKDSKGNTEKKIKNGDKKTKERP